MTSYIEFDALTDTLAVHVLDDQGGEHVEISTVDRTSEDLPVLMEG